MRFPVRVKRYYRQIQVVRLSAVVHSASGGRVTSIQSGNTPAIFYISQALVLYCFNISKSSLFIYKVSPQLFFPAGSCAKLVPEGTRALQ